MSTVPRQQIIHTVNDRNRDMQRILRCLGGYDTQLNQGFRNVKRALVDQKQGQVSHNVLSPFGCVQVARAALTQDGFRNNRFKLIPPRPPGSRNLLMSRAENGLAWPSRQVADNGCFDVYPALHDFSFA